MQEMPGKQMPPSPPQSKGDSPEALVEGIHADLMKLQQMLGNSPAAEKVAALVAGLESVVSEGAGPGPGDEGPKPMGPVDANAGPGGVPMR